MPKTVTRRLLQWEPPPPPKKGAREAVPVSLVLGFGSKAGLGPLIPRVFVRVCFPFAEKREPGRNAQKGSEAVMARRRKGGFGRLFSIPTLCHGWGGCIRRVNEREAAAFGCGKGMVEKSGFFRRSLSCAADAAAVPAANNNQSFSYPEVSCSPAENEAVDTQLPRLCPITRMTPQAVHTSYTCTCVCVCAIPWVETHDHSRCRSRRKKLRERSS
ncbi:hypothetical protein LX36DRAFT_391090 [Colletotrichum falcatum]|nr:hypothetical protein LX36DRAFT_391090 [Colletotrichum falcatum]